ncbi:glycosyltransferase family 4 protein [Iodobacter ciconiae]|uniref:Glycosyltransferase family 1 protein n=1 Tax=Iodobacter ciconiae TaxID=2496266 RepID=A0A3S8ZQ90_9NEIS|nr:glycosyltransferase family 1 protein [Iodobacter ciconiae]AZN35637.1 glycosyltransferase family 1 protein [Iodobacter ciconiae]
MRIGIDYRPVTAAPYSGIARQVLALEKALQAAGEVQRFTAAPLEHVHRQIAHCPASASPAHGLHRPRERIKFEFGFLPQAIKASQLDVYIATANTGLPVWKTPPDTRYVLLLHDVFQLTMDNHHGSRLKALVYRQIDRFGIGRSVALADAIWTPSCFTAKEVARLFPAAAAKIAVLPNAVPSVLHAEPLCLPGGIPAQYWLVVGTREPRKNIPRFVAAWQAARQQQSNVPPLVLVGSLSDLPLSQQNLDGLMAVSGISDAQLTALYKYTACLWQPSLAEGFGLPVIEALAQGAPVAVAEGSALNEITPPDSPRFSPHDGQAMQRLMLNLAQSPQGNDHSRQAWAECFAMPAYAERVEHLLAALQGGA